MSHHVFHERATDFWLARGAVLIIIALQLKVINPLTWGPWWLAPTLELSLLALLSFDTLRSQRTARERDPAKAGLMERRRRRMRTLAITLTALITLSNFGALISLVEQLVLGSSAPGRLLLLDALNIWVTNVLIFTLWYWNIDHGGPAMHGMPNREGHDFLFPQMSMPGAPQNTWLPGFVDYLFLSFTNATAFSPTDTLPLSQRAKLLMMAQSTASLLTVALVAARAVNILGP
ncbi:hypothetical protein [Alsobacter sp. R-9]